MLKKIRARRARLSILTNLAGRLTWATAAFTGLTGRTKAKARRAAINRRLREPLNLNACRCEDNLPFCRQCYPAKDWGTFFGMEAALSADAETQARYSETMKRSGVNRD